MKKLLLGLLVVMVLGVFASSAQADRSDSPSCNTNPGHWVTAQAPTFSGGGAGFATAYIHFTQYCGTGNDTVEAELQSSTDGGNHWTDVNGSNGKSDFSFNTPANEGNVQWSRTSSASGTVLCGGGILFRDHVYYANQADDTSGIVQPACS